MLTANDTKVVKNGEKLLKPFTKKPAHAVILIQVLRTCEIESVRHHAALILRKNLNAYYSTYGRKEQNELKAEMLRLLLAEPVSVVATAIAGGVAAIADAVFSSKQTWDELFTLLVSLSQDPQPQLRVLTHKLLNEVMLFQSVNDICDDIFTFCVVMRDNCSSPQSPHSNPCTAFHDWLSRCSIRRCRGSPSCNCFIHQSDR